MRRRCLDLLQDDRTNGINGSVFVGSGTQAVDQIEQLAERAGADGSSSSRT